MEKLPPPLIPRALLLLRHQRKSTGACCSTMRYAGIRGNSHMRFPDEFAFQLTPEEFAGLRSQIGDG